MINDAEALSAKVIRRTTSRLTMSDKLDHLRARWGIRRMGHRVEPGLYAIGAPNADSPVLVTSNYTLSFDALRSSLEGFDAYILVLDTQGVNVWCAAGKGTFGTEELIRRIEASGLAGVVTGRRLLLPQLGAPGIAAHEVWARTGFQVEYGPVRAQDLPEYLKTGKATAEMRRVRFSLEDRAAVIPVELVQAMIWFLPLLVVQFLMSGWRGVLQLTALLLAGAVLFPLLLPYLPGRQFSVKGFVLGTIVALPFVLYLTIGQPGLPLSRYISRTLSLLLVMPAVVAFLALNFTGSTTFTSRTSVRREIFRFVPVMAGMVVAGIVIDFSLPAIGRFGGF